jgi:hypothetical protein
MEGKARKGHARKKGYLTSTEREKISGFIFAYRGK